MLIILGVLFAMDDGIIEEVSKSSMKQKKYLVAYLSKHPIYSENEDSFGGILCNLFGSLRVDTANKTYTFDSLCIAEGNDWTEKDIKPFNFPFKESRKYVRQIINLAYQGTFQNFVETKQSLDDKFMANNMQVYIILKFLKSSEESWSKAQASQEVLQEMVNMKDSSNSDKEHEIYIEDPNCQKAAQEADLEFSNRVLLIQNFANNIPNAANELFGKIYKDDPEATKKAAQKATNNVNAFFDWYLSMNVIRKLEALKKNK